MRRKVIIIGAAGRDFHNFNTRYRDDEAVEVVAFTAAQIPGIEGRRFPPELSGQLYPDGIPIHAEEDLPRLIDELGVDECAFSHRDVSYEPVMRVSAVVMAAGASFTLLGPTDTQIHSTKPVVAVCAVRTGAGKSQTARKVVEVLMSKGLKVVAIRHPMPYGNLARQKVQRFAEVADLERHECTIEEMEEYEPHIVRGNVIYAGNDYEAIVRAAENDPDGCDVIVWDGGNNDVAFYDPDLLITVADPHRPGHELGYYPGEVNFRRADVIVINKMKTASPDGIAEVQSDGDGGRGRVARRARRSLDRHRQAGARRRRRPDADPRRDEDRGGRRRRHPTRGSGVRRSAAVPGGQPRRYLRDLSRHRHGVARDGIRDRSDEGSAGDDRCHRV
jgi:predicted GTPase